MLQDSERETPRQRTLTKENLIELLDGQIVDLDGVLLIMADIGLEEIRHAVLIASRRNYERMEQEEKSAHEL